MKSLPNRGRYSEDDLYRNRWDGMKHERWAFESPWPIGKQLAVFMTLLVAGACVAGYMGISVYDLITRLGF